MRSRGSLAAVLATSALIASITMTAGEARAADAITPTSASTSADGDAAFAAPAPDPAAGAAPAAAPAAAAAPAPLAAPAAAPNVRVRVYASKKRPAQLFALRSQPTGPTWSPVCSTPCTTDLPASAHLRVVLEGHEDEPHDFVLGTESEIDLDVGRSGRGALAGGIVMTSFGGLSILTGTVLLLVSNIGAGFDGSGSAGVVGSVVTVGGVALLAGGILLITNRSWVPAVRQQPHDHRRDRRSHVEAVLPNVLLQDMALARPRDTAPPAPSTPLGMSFSF